MRTIATIVVMLLVNISLGQAPAEAPPFEAGRLAQQVRVESVVWTWVASANDLTVVPEMSKFPTGMSVVADGGNLVFTLMANTPGFYTAEITVSAQVKPFPGWKGALVEARMKAIITWFVFDKNALPFLNGFGDQLIQPEPTSTN